MFNEIIAQATTFCATAIVATPAVLGIKGAAPRDSIKCQTIGEYSRQAFGLDPKPDYLRIRREQTRQRILSQPKG